MPNRIELAKQLLKAALAVEPMERDAFLDKACDSDLYLRQMVQDLLAEESRTVGLLERLPLDHFGQSMVDTVSDAESGSTIANGNVPPPIPAGRFKPGYTLIDRFMIVRYIAKGGMGEVYEAEDRFLQSVHVALKTILPHIADDPASQRRFEKEVLLARELTHPNLCPIYDIFHCDQPPPSFLFLTMKLLAGETLGARLNGSIPIPIEEGLAILKQMAIGLASIHAAGILHRDVKPNNIMLDGTGPKLHLYITDFGLAREHGSEKTLSSNGLLAGTPGYLAPELLLGHPPSHGSDLFAFGVVLHEIFTGKKPSGEAGASLLVSSGLPSFSKRLIRECLSHDPNRRCCAFEQALRVLDPKSEYSYSTYPGRRVLTRRHFAASAVTALCAAAAGAWWKRDEFDNLIHPLPQKRFVAVLNWPRTIEARMAPILNGVLGAIKSELARVEAFDRDLFVISPEDASQEAMTTAGLKEVCDPLGVNLVLAASALPGSHDFHIFLRLLDPLSSRPLRGKQLRSTVAEVTSLLPKAVLAAASLLNLTGYIRESARIEPGTRSAPAYAAFEAAEALMKQDNDAGLDAAIDKYKQAVELDPRYTNAHAKLALAYFRFYVLHGDPAALSLARGNCDVALRLNPQSIEGHLALSSVLEQTGDAKGAIREIGEALSLDPANPRTLVYQAQLFTRFDRWAEAEATLGRLIEARPNNWLAHNELGVIFNSQGKYSRALAEFREASLAAPKNALALNNVGAVYLQQGKIAEAKDSLRKSFALNPNDAAVSLASLLRAEGNYTDAIVFALKAVELGATECVNWLELGDCYLLARGRRNEAKNAYVQAVRVQEEELRTDPTNGPGWMFLALCRAKVGEHETVLSLVKKAELAYADDMDSQLCKVRTLELLGLRDGALTTVRRCLERGATGFQIKNMPDLERLRNDQRYQEMARLSSPKNEIGL